MVEVGRGQGGVGEDVAQLRPTSERVAGAPWGARAVRPAVRPLVFKDMREKAPGGERCSFFAARGGVLGLLCFLHL